jgi:hypothetical protein
MIKNHQPSATAPTMVDNNAAMAFRRVKLSTIVPAASKTNRIERTPVELTSEVTKGRITSVVKPR